MVTKKREKHIEKSNVVTKIIKKKQKAINIFDELTLTITKHKHTFIS